MDAIKESIKGNFKAGTGTRDLLNETSSGK